MTHRRLAGLAFLCGALALAACATVGGDRPASAASPGPAVHRRAAALPARPGRSTPLGNGSVAGPTGTGSPTTGATGAAPPSGPASPPSSPRSDIMRTTGSAAVALTFDDGPGMYTPQILALLREHGVKATFCLIGVNVQANPGLVQAIVRDGHTLCNHTWRHDLYLGSRSPDQIRADLQRTSDAIHRAVPGVPIRYFRNPGGLFTPGTVAVARELGMTSLGWSGDPSDWNVKAWPAGSVMSTHVISYVERVVRPGMVMLSHDAGGDRSGTVAAYRVLLPYLLARFELIALPT